uniref:Uncharacterized protein n=1 Tax=Triticum urartu TaxID=4572 RepID=A0A8R7K0Z2_TRIUA
MPSLPSSLKQQAGDHLDAYRHHIQTQRSGSCSMGMINWAVPKSSFRMVATTMVAGGDGASSVANSSVQRFTVGRVASACGGCG